MIQWVVRCVDSASVAVRKTRRPLPLRNLYLAGLQVDIAEANLTSSASQLLLKSSSVSATMYAS